MLICHLKRSKDPPILHTVSSSKAMVLSSRGIFMQPDGARISLVWEERTRYGNWSQNDRDSEGKDIREEMLICHLKKEQAHNVKDPQFCTLCFFFHSHGSHPGGRSFAA
jgi:hypothetical protein